MTEAGGGAPETAASLVWIDSGGAVVVRLSGGAAQVERIDSDVPVHRRGMGHVRHDPLIRHGGGRPQRGVENHRIEHLNRFVARVAGSIPATDDLLILGPGTVPGQLARHVRDDDAHHGRQRHVSYEAAARVTDGQLVARLRRFAGAEAPRRTVGTPG